MLYTGHGDAGFTNVIGGPALRKCDVRVETLGAIDEAQAQLGLARVLLATTPWAAAIYRIQGDLRLVMSEIAMVHHGHHSEHCLTTEHLRLLEADLMAWDQQTGGFICFTTPGDSLPGAHLHIARTVIRRAERQAVALYDDTIQQDTLILTYLNRLSSWVFALALLVESASTHAAA